MSHLDSSSLATYNSLTDPNLQSYFSNERIRSHLKNAGLISDHGEIISEGEYRSRLTRREHAKHVRHMLAENIVNRAIDMERLRHAEIKCQYEMISKAALVNNIKEARKRGGPLFGPFLPSNNMDLLSIDQYCIQIRQKSANPQNAYNEETHISRLPSAQICDDHPTTHSSNVADHGRRRHRCRRQRSSQQLTSLSKNRSSSSVQRTHSSNKYLNSLTSPSCQITMVYYGPHTKVDYDHLVFEQMDEVIVMQQHCGGENLIVYKNYLKPGAEFTFESRRHSDYSFGISLYVKGLIDSRISTCCEYKHRHGVKLGGERGHFAIKSVHGSIPCLRCRYEHEARLKKYAQSPKHADDDSKIPITIPLPAADEPKAKETSILIPVPHTTSSNLNNNYPEDFDDSDTQKETFIEGYSTDSSGSRLHMSKQKQKSKSNDSIPKDHPHNDQQHETPRSISKSSLNDENHPQSAKSKLTDRTSSRSTTSSNASKQSKTKFHSAHQKPVNTQSHQNEKTDSHDNFINRETKTRYRVTIYPSHDSNGKFKPNHNSEISLRLNKQIKGTHVKNNIDQGCPEFEPGVQKEFEIDLIQDTDEQPETLTIRYVNSDPTAKKWKLEKIVLVNIKTHDTTTFPCNEILSRNESDSCAEKTFTIQLQDCLDEDTPRNWNDSLTNFDNVRQHHVQEEQQLNDDDNDIINQSNNNNSKKEERFPSFASMDDDDASYRKIFRKLDPDNKLELGSTSSSRTSRSFQQNDIKREQKKNQVDLLDDLNDLTDLTPRSNDQINHASVSQKTIDKTQKEFKNSHRTANDGDEDD